MDKKPRNLGSAINTLHGIVVMYNTCTILKSDFEIVILGEVHLGAKLLIY